MATYIQLYILTEEGRAETLKDPDFLLKKQWATKMRGISVLGVYGVLGQYDFISIVEAPDDATIARFSIELGVRAGVHITTLPAIPISRLEPAGEEYLREMTSGASLSEDTGREDS